MINLFISTFFLLSCFISYTQAQDIEGEVINIEVEVSEKKDKPERKDPGERSERSGNERDSKEKGEATRKKGKSAVNTITIGDMTFHITNASRDEFNHFIELNKMSKYAEGVAYLASFFTIFQIISLDKDHPWIHGTFNISMSSIGIKEIFIKLSSPLIVNKALRVQAINFINLNITAAVTNNRFGDAAFWSHLKEMLRYPERYLEGGVRRDPSSNKLTLRKRIGIEHQKIFVGNINANERFAFKEFVTALRNNPVSNEYVDMADMVYQIDYNYSQLKRITLRDEILLNHALVSLSCDSKKYFHNKIRIQQRGAYRNSIWFRMESYLYDMNWHKHWNYEIEHMLPSYGQEESFYPSDFIDESILEEADCDWRMYSRR